MKRFLRLPRERDTPKEKNQQRKERKVIDNSASVSLFVLGRDKRNYPHMSRDQCERLSSLSPTSSTYTDVSDKKGAFLFFVLTQPIVAAGKAGGRSDWDTIFLLQGPATKQFPRRAFQKNGTLISTRTPGGEQEYHIPDSNGVRPIARGIRRTNCPWRTPPVI